MLAVPDSGANTSERHLLPETGAVFLVIIHLLSCLFRAKQIYDLSYELVEPLFF